MAESRKSQHSDKIISTHPNTVRRPILKRRSMNPQDLHDSVRSSTNNEVPPLNSVPTSQETHHTSSSLKPHAFFEYNPQARISETESSSAPFHPNKRPARYSQSPSYQCSRCSKLLDQRQNLAEIEIEPPQLENTNERQESTSTDLQTRRNLNTSMSRITVLSERAAIDAEEDVSHEQGEVVDEEGEDVVGEGEEEVVEDEEDNDPEANEDDWEPIEKNMKIYDFAEYGPEIPRIRWLDLIGL